MGFLVRAKGILRPGVERYFIGMMCPKSKNNRKIRFLSSPCGVGVARLQDHKEALVGPNKVKGLGLINTLMELTKLGRRRLSKELHFPWNGNAMILNEATNPKLTREMVLDIGLGITRDPTIGVASNLEDL